MAVASVLVVDDDVAASASARELLTAAGYVVTQVSNGRQALQRVRVQPPDLLITEIFMPDGDGVELIAALQRSDQRMQIIAVSERRFFDSLDLFDVVAKLGADAVLQKPLEAEKLLDVVAGLLALEAPLDDLVVC